MTVAVLSEQLTRGRLDPVTHSGVGGLDVEVLVPADGRQAMLKFAMDLVRGESDTDQRADLDRG